jgi:hypothetical protein
MTADNIACYRANYEIRPWKEAAETSGNYCAAPFGAIIAVNALCDEVERLQSAMQRTLHMLLTEPNTHAALFEAENILRNAITNYQVD